MRLLRSAFVLVLFLGFLLLATHNASGQMPVSGVGVIYGWVYGFTWDDRLVPLVWVQVTASNPNYPPFTASTGANGLFELTVPAGTYNLTVAPAGYQMKSSMVPVSDGSSSMASFYLEESHVPIPEFPTQMVTAVMIIALAVTMLVSKTSKRKQSK
jgi:hypothetical protein